MTPPPIFTKSNKRAAAQRRRWILAGAGAAFIIVCCVYFFFDPSEAVWMPHCVWKGITGTDCPGCGSQRMAHALLHADFDAAWRANPFLMLLLPLIPLYAWAETMRTARPKLYKALHRPAAVRMLIVAVLIWWILRNIPPLSQLSAPA